MKVDEVRPWKSYKMPFDLANSDLKLEKKKRLLDNWKDYYIQICEAENEGMTKEVTSKNAIFLQEINKVIIGLEQSH